MGWDAKAKGQHPADDTGAHFFFQEGLKKSNFSSPTPRMLARRAARALAQRAARRPRCAWAAACRPARSCDTGAHPRAAQKRAADHPQRAARQAQQAQAAQQAGRDR